MKTIVIQPGPFGDIIECAPIAKYYSDLGHQIVWPVAAQYYDILTYFDYVTPEILPDGQIHDDWLQSDVLKIFKLYDVDRFEKVLNLADRGPHPPVQRRELSASAKAKYRMADLPFDLKYHLSWTRNPEKEEKLYDKVVGKLTNYVVCHVESSTGHSAALPHLNKEIVFVDVVEGFQIFDWLKVFENAEEIYCTESAVHCFVDNIYKEFFPDKPKFLLRREGLATGEHYTESPSWDKRYL